MFGLHRKKVDKTAARMDELEERVEVMKRQNIDRIFNASDVISVGSSNIGRHGAERRRERIDTRGEKFLLAKRTIRIWLIQGVNEGEILKGIDSFLKNALVMEQRNLDTIIVESVERMRTSPRAKHHLKVRVVFRDEDNRETVLSYARNLSSYMDKNNGQPTAGLRMEIPDYLGSVHKLLIDMCYYLKTKHGVIKYDNIEQSLYIALQVQGEDHWRRITPKMAESLRKREEQQFCIEFEGTLSPPGRIPATGANRSPLSSLPSTSTLNVPSTSRTPSWIPPSLGDRDLN